MNFIEKRICQIIYNYCQSLNITLDQLELMCLEQDKNEIHGVCLPEHDHAAFYFIIHEEDEELEFFLPNQIEDDVES